MLGYFLSSLSNMYSCQRTGYVHRTEVGKSATSTGDLQRHSHQQKQKACGKTKHKQMPHPTRHQLVFFTLQLCSPCETILCPFSDAGTSLIPLLRKLRNKREINNYMIQKNKYFTTIHKRASEPLCYCKALANHSSHSNVTPSYQIRFLT